MALLSPAFVRGLATTFGGESLATQLAAANQQLEAGQLELTRAKEQDKASQAWAKAMAEIFASSPQGPPVSLPTAPQPGAPSVPQTGEGERRIMHHSDTVGLLVLRARSRPLVKGVRRN